MIHEALEGIVKAKKEALSTISEGIKIYLRIDKWVFKYLRTKNIRILMRLSNHSQSNIMKNLNPAIKDPHNKNKREEKN